LKAAVGTCDDGACTGGCLGETPDGSCPIFAASNDATGNPYGVIGGWDVSLVTSMNNSKCTISPSLCGHGSVVVFLNTWTRVSSAQFSYVLLFVFWNGTFYCFGISFLYCTLLSSCSVLWRICVQSGRVLLEYWGGDKYGKQ
jgi:hypothetical protein